MEEEQELWNRGESFRRDNPVLLGTGRGGDGRPRGKALLSCSSPYKQGRGRPPFVLESNGGNALVSLLKIKRDLYLS